MTYEVTLIDLGTVEQQDVIHWARENCPGFCGVFCYENEYLTDDPEHYDFVFDNEKDATLFGLKFGSH